MAVRTKKPKQSTEELPDQQGIFPNRTAQREEINIGVGRTQEGVGSQAVGTVGWKMITIHIVASLKVYQFGGRRWKRNPKRDVMKSETIQRRRGDADIKRDRLALNPGGSWGQ